MTSMQCGKRVLGLIVSGLWAAGLLGAGSAMAEDYESGFGFQISVPEVWLVLTRHEVAEKSDTLLSPNGPSALASIPREMRHSVFERIAAGELEVFYRQDGIEDEFIDNVNVMMQPSPLPANAEQLATICMLLPEEFSKIFGRPIGMEACEIRDVVDHRALYLQFDGAIPGTTTLQYQLARGRNATLVLTATAPTTNVPRMMGEFEDMVSSIRRQ
ncbi:MAG: hypothetical protein AB8G23_07085 [Myxococcota bacterium]